MDRPMRLHGPTLQERALASALAATGGVLLLWTVATAIAPGALLPAKTLGAGWLAGGALAAGVLLTLAGSGLRQNRAALDLGFAFLAAAAAATLVYGIVEGEPVPIVAGALMAGAFALLYALRRAAIRARYRPRFLSPRAFETMIAVADTMIDGDGREATSATDVAIRVDRLLADVKAPIKQEIKLLLVIVEWVLPLRVGRPLPFSTLGSHTRRSAVEKVIDTRIALLRDIARTLKVLSCVGYYGDPATQRAIGYRPFEERERSTGVDDRPLTHPDPFEVQAPAP